MDYIPEYHFYSNFSPEILFLARFDKSTIFVLLYLLILLVKSMILNEFQQNLLEKFSKFALRSPTATGSPFGRSLASWFGPGFEIFRLWKFPIFRFFNFLRFSIFRFSIFRFFIIVIGFYPHLDDVHKISFKSVDGIRS